VSRKSVRRILEGMPDSWNGDGSLAFCIAGHVVFRRMRATISFFLAALTIHPAPGLAADDVAIPGGLPKSRVLSPRTWARTLENEGFTIGYSELRRNPLWVVYRATAVKRHRTMPRPERFSTDTRTLAQVTSGDYSRSGYTRGHLAPNYLMSQLYGRKAQHQTFLMSNVTPQRAALNQKVWQRLEEVEADHFARWFKSLWVVTGPVFDAQLEFMPSGVEIPDAFFRVLVRDDEGELSLLAFVVPQEVRGDEPLDRYVVTVDEVESRTGLDFFSELEDEGEEKVEAVGADRSAWRLGEICCLPARY
jgi:endonuclease G